MVKDFYQTYSNSKDRSFCYTQSRLSQNTNYTYISALYTKCSDHGHINDFMDELRKLIETPNNKGVTPMEKAFTCSKREDNNITGWYVKLLDKFDDHSEKCALSYIAYQAATYKT